MSNLCTVHVYLHEILLKMKGDALNPLPCEEHVTIL